MSDRRSTFHDALEESRRRQEERIRSSSCLRIYLWMYQRNHGIYYEHDCNDDGRKWICSSCSGSIHITSGDCDQCSIYGDRNCDSVSAGEKDLCAHGIEGDITDFFLWKLADTYELW